MYHKRVVKSGAVRVVAGIGISLLGISYKGSTERRKLERLLAGPAASPLRGNHQTRLVCRVVLGLRGV